MVALTTYQMATDYFIKLFVKQISAKLNEIEAVQF